MKLADISIERPVFATVLSLLIVLVGVMSWQRLPVREYPDVDLPVVSVRTVYQGASADIIESQITTPLEDSLAGIEGIRSMKSVSREEVSQITVEFRLERDADAAANDVRDRVARVRELLPEDARESVVAKIDADAQAIMWIAFFSDRHTPLEITDYADRQVKDRLQTLPGVASVIIGGERKYAMRLWLDAARLAARGLTPGDVEAALHAENVEIPAGRVEGEAREFTLRVDSSLNTPEQFERMVVKVVNGQPVRLGEVGRAELGALDDRNIVRVNGQPAVGLGVVKQSNANALQVGRAVKAELPRIAASLPPGMGLEQAFDTTLFIEESLNSVYTTIVEALLLVVAVVFLFLRTPRATLIPFVTIPVSLIGAFIFLYVLGYSINVLTLLGLVLAIGLVVDDAIVMLENIQRRIEHGQPPLQAAFEGSREIAFAVLAMTLTLAAVFAPLAFIGGATGRLFSEFALAVASAVLVSGFVALSLTPMMCARVLREEKSHGALYNRLERLMETLHLGYQRLLRRALARRAAVLLTGAAVALGGAGLFFTLKQELAPVEDRGILIGFMIAPEGATLDYTDRYARAAEGLFTGLPEIRRFFMVVAPGLEKPNPVNNAIAFVTLKPWGERAKTQQQLSAELMPKFFGLPGVLGFLINPPSLGQSFRDLPVQYVLLGNSYETLDASMNKLLEKARAWPGLQNPDSDLKLNKPQLAVTVNRDKVSDVGARADDVGRALETLFGGRQVTRFKREGKQYDVVLQMAAGDRASPADIGGVQIRGHDGGLVQLDNLLTVQETVAPKELNHYDRFRAAILSANVTPGYSLGDALDFLNKAAAEALPREQLSTLAGQSREFSESGQELALIFLLALAFIYLVLAAQFESFVDPLIILLTVPLALTGALAALKILALLGHPSGTLNVFSKVGLIMLIGLITKHGILIVNFANDLQTRGRDRVTAVIEAAGLRLRPILMTTGAMVLGAVPLALATGAGAESRQPIGWVIVGGLLVGTVFTLFIIPAAYTLLAQRHEHTPEVAAHSG